MNMYPKTCRFLEASGEVPPIVGWQDEWRLQDDESGAALITWLVDAYQSYRADRHSKRVLMAAIRDDSAQLIESGMTTLPVYLAAYWSRFLLQEEANSLDISEPFFNIIEALYDAAALYGTILAMARAFSRVVEEALEPHWRMNEAAINAITSFLAWAERWNPTILAHWHPKLERLAKDALAPKDMRALAAFSLVWTPQNITGIDGREIAQFALKEFTSSYSPLDLVCLFGRICDGRGSVANEWLPEITRMTELHVSSRINSSLPEADELEERALGLRVLGPIIRTLVEAGQDADAVAITALWMGVDRPHIRTTKLVTLIMSQSVGAIFAAKGRVRYIANPLSITPLIQALNEALRLQVRNVDEIAWEPTPHDPRHSRVPDPIQESALLEALETYLPVRIAGDFIFSKETRALLAIPAIPIPLQGWLLRSLGRTMPLTVSLRNPMPDRSIRRVLLWAEGSLYSEIERDEVNSILRRADIAVDIPKRYTVTEFAQRYHSDDYDVIWVASHGRYEPNAPHLSKLQVGVDEWVDTRLLRESPESATRRLLVLNACEGGATFMGGGLLDSGLAASAVSPSQAVIAHLWPIRAWPDAVGFGIILSFLLVNESDDCLPGFRRTFFEAYQECLRILSAGPERVRGFLAGMGQLSSQLYASLDRALYDSGHASLRQWPESFVDWAGSVFYELSLSYHLGAKRSIEVIGAGQRTLAVI